MPKINIKERDLTTNPFESSTTNTLFVAENTLSTVSTTSGTASSAFDIPVYVTEVKKNTTSAGTLTGYTINKDYTLSTTTSIDSLDFVAQALGLGGEVYMATSYGTVSGSTISGAGEYLSDRNQFDIKLLLADEETLSEAMVVAQARKDAAIILSTTSTSVSEDTASICMETVDYASGFYSDEKVSYKGKYVIPAYGKDLDGVVTNPAYAWVLSYLYSVQSGNAEWLPVAGYKRGYIPGVSKAGFLTEAEIDKMQPKTTPTSGTDSDMISVNPICYVNPWGVRIWGNRTALAINQTGAESTTNKLVASSFANIRMLLCDLKKAMYVASKKYQFEQNTDVLWVNFTSEVNATLEAMKTTYGIAAYRWIRGARERATINAVLQIIPVEGVEDFNLTVELTDELLEVAE